MKKLFKKATCKNTLQVAPTENYFFPVPTQALKSWRYFDRFDVNHYIKVLNAR